MEQEKNILIEKLDVFIRKYYKNKLIRGAVFFIAVFLAFFLFVVLLEYFGHFGIKTRTAFFYLYLLINAAILVYLIIIPLLNLYKIGKHISYEQAAQIIGEHFPEISDKLLNALQLMHSSVANFESIELLKAGIEQKTAALKPIPFTAAIDLRKNRKYIRYVAPSLIVLFVLMVSVPAVITQPASRIIQHSTYFEKPAPFSFEIVNGFLETPQQEDFTLQIRVKGENIPEQVNILVDQTSFRMAKVNNIDYKFVFKNVQKDIKFTLKAGRVQSKEYTLKVLPKPIILYFETELDYPAYTEKTDEKLQNTGDLIVPCGTKIIWRFYTRDARTLKMFFQKTPVKIEKSGPVSFSFETQICRNSFYTVVTGNEFMISKDTLQYAINVIQDTYPTITASEFIDSTYEKHRFFKGFVKDDYGFSKLTFNSCFINLKDTLDKEKTPQSIQIQKVFEGNQAEFYYYFDMSTMTLTPGDEIEYYFEIWDNDAVSGPKSSRSEKMYFKVPTLEEIEENAEKASREAKDQMQNAVNEAKILQRKIEDLNRKLIDKPTINWQERRQIEDLLERQKQLQKNVENIREQNKQNQQNEQQYKEIDEKILEKQKELERLFEEIMTDEMKKLFEELEQLLDKIDKDKVNDVLEKMKFSAEELEAQLDRELELFKRLEFEKQMTETIEKLKKLAEEQEKLSDETKEGNDKEALKKEQEKINNKFQDIKKDLDELEKKNTELESPGKLTDTKNGENEIQNELNNSSDNIESKKFKKASESQKKASEQMDQLSEKLEQAMEAMFEMQLGEDIEALREILENLVTVSFDQEDLMGKSTKIKTTDPQYLKLIQGQKKINDDLKMVEDSLLSLAKRQVAVKPFIMRELNEVQRNSEKVIKFLNERQTPTAAGKQQYVMTSVNNLALLLSEVLESMQQEMMEMQNAKANKSCSNPKMGKGGTPKMSTLKQLQEQLNKQIQQLKEGMQKGGQTGKNQPSMSEQLARLAAQQEAIRKQLQQYSDDLKKDGVKDGNLQNAINKMEETETDLVNKIISRETLKRQEEILTRLLESERAERQREIDEKRESTEVKNQKYSNPEKFFEYNKNKIQETELLKTIPPSLTPFYRKKVNDYFYNSKN